MRLLSSTDVAIALALKAGTLRSVEREGRFGAYVALEDAAGVIEVHNSAEEAEQRIASILDVM